MISFLTSIGALIVTLGLLIAFHEFGHYWTARRLGVKVLRYCIGFGKPIWLRRYGADQTEYAIAAIPLGGYVKMLDEREGEVAPQEQHRAFNRQPVWRRFAIVAAGPIFNFIFAIFAFWLMYLIGVPGIKPVVGEVVPQSAAAIAGLQSGDEIIAVDDESTPTWNTARIALLDKALDNDSVRLQVRDADGSLRNLLVSLDGLTAEAKQKDLLRYLGVSPWRPVLPAVLGELESGGPASKAGLQNGDRIISADDVVIENWRGLVEFIRQHPARSVQLEIERDGLPQSVTVATDIKVINEVSVGYIGAAPASSGPLPKNLQAEIQYPVFEAIAAAGEKTWQLSVLTIRMIGKMILGEVSVTNLSGPITIATYAGYTASAGLSAFLYFLAVVSISLGVLNLLPVPMLDGGHLMYYLIEIVTGSPLSEDVQIGLQKIGIVLLIMLMTLALYNDIARLFAD